MSEGVWVILDTVWYTGYPIKIIFGHNAQILHCSSSDLKCIKTPMCGGLWMVSGGVWEVSGSVWMVSKGVWQMPGGY